MLMSEFDNLMKWNGRGKPFYEVYYLKLNDPSLRVALWLRYTFLSPVKGPPTASVWGIFTSDTRPGSNVILKETVPLSQANFFRSRFSLNIGGATLNNSSASGRITGEGKEIAWDLTWEPKDSSFKHYPFFFYLLPWPPSKVVAPNLSVQGRGWFEVNGVRYQFNSMLHQGHVWGRRYSERWTWSNCIFFLEDKNAVFEMVARPPLMLGYLDVGGERIRFRSRGDLSLTGGGFEVKKRSILLRGRIGADPKNIVGITYEGPLGETRYCYNTNLADATIELFRKERGKWVLCNKLTSNGTTAYETVQPVPVTGICLSL